jgi:hypothetical protein
MDVIIVSAIITLGIAMMYWLSAMITTIALMISAIMPPVVASTSTSAMMPGFALMNHAVSSMEMSAVPYLLSVEILSQPIAIIVSSRILNVEMLQV